MADGKRPVISAKRAGEQSGALQVAFSKTAPRRASRSRFGMRTIGCPYIGSDSAAIWSNITNKILGLPTDSALGPLSTAIFQPEPGAAVTRNRKDQDSL